MSDDPKAQRLAEWLDAPPGTEPPDDLDAEVVGAVWALSPDRAPAPRVTLDDILAGVETGPFATGGRTTEEAPGFPATPERPALVALPGGRTATGTAHGGPPARKPRRFWASPAFGIGLAAAAAALVGIPIAGQLSRDALLQKEVAAEGQLAPAPTAAATPPEAPTPAPSDARTPAPSDATTSAPAGLPEMDGAPEPAAQAPKAAEPMPGLVAEGAPADAPAPAAGDAPALEGGELRKESAFDRPSAGTAPTRAAPSGGLPEMQAGKDDSAKKLDSWKEPPAEEKAVAPSTSANAGPGAGGSATAWQPQSQAAPSTPTPNAAPVTTAEAPPPPVEPTTKTEEYARGYADDAEDEVTASAPAPSQSASGTRRAAEPDAALARERSVAQAAEETPKKAKAPGRSAPSAPAASAPAARDAKANATAMPMDYASSWYKAYPDVVPAYQAAIADEAAGRWDAAAAKWRALASDARTDVAQDAALRGAKALRAAGKPADALALVETGLRRSGANTPFRAALLALRAELLAAAGRPADADASQKAAEQLNDQR